MAVSNEKNIFSDSKLWKVKTFKKKYHGSKNTITLVSIFLEHFLMVSYGSQNEYKTGNKISVTNWDISKIEAGCTSNESEISIKQKTERGYDSVRLSRRPSLNEQPAHGWPRPIEEPHPSGRPPTREARRREHSWAEEAIVFTFLQVAVTVGTL